MGEYTAAQFHRTEADKLEATRRELDEMKEARDE